MSLECPVIETAAGKVHGCTSRSTDPDSKWVFQFLGVPFGKSTAGERRFSKSEICNSWSGVYEATNLTSDPPQSTELAAVYAEYYPSKNSLKHDLEFQSEDCLHLNLFTPSCNKSKKLAVMVYVVGGGFMRSSALRADGTALAGMNDVVVVCPNYRPNALGYLSLGKDSICPGNNALQDILLALRWVQENICNFGGDPNNVTLFGESAGAVMTQVLMLSHKTDDLIHKAIVMSGFVLFPGMFAADGRKMSEVFLKRLDINLESSNEGMMKQLRKFDLHQLISIQEGHKTNENLGIFKPCFDGDILTKLPIEIMKSGKQKKIPLLTGVASDEMGALLSLNNPPGYMDGLSKDVLGMFYVEIFKSFLGATDEQAATMTDVLVTEYGKDIPDSDHFKYSKIYNCLTSDFGMGIPMLNTAQLNSMSSAPTYVYVMKHQPELNHSVTNGPKTKNKMDFVKCDHGDIIHWIWGEPFIQGELSGGSWFTDADRNISRITMAYFTNFAKTGNPNKGQQVPTEWPLYDTAKLQHIEISCTPTVGKNYIGDKKILIEKLTGQNGG